MASKKAILEDCKQCGKNKCYTDLTCAKCHDTMCKKWAAAQSLQNNLPTLNN